MSEKEKTMAERLNALLSQMDTQKQDVFIARGEGFVEGYRAGLKDASASVMASAAPSA